MPALSLGFVSGQQIEKWYPLKSPKTFNSYLYTFEDTLYLNVDKNYQFWYFIKLKGEQEWIKRNFYPGKFCRKDNFLFRYNYEGLSRSNDGGKTWSIINPPIKATDMIATKKAILITNYVWGGRTFIYKSEDNGDTWKEVYTFDYNYAANFFENKGRIFAAGFNQLAYSDDNGETWVTDKNLIDIRTFTAHDNIIFASGHGYLYKSINNGNSWKLIYSPTFSPSCMALVGADLFIAGGNGVFRSNDLGESWEEWNRNLPSIGAQDLILFDGTLYKSGKGLATITENDLSWSIEHVHQELPSSIIDMGQYEDKLYFSVGDYHGGVFYLLGADNELITYSQNLSAYNISTGLLNLSKKGDTTYAHYRSHLAFSTNPQAYWTVEKHNNYIFKVKERNENLIGMSTSILLSGDMGRNWDTTTTKGFKEPYGETCYPAGIDFDMKNDKYFFIRELRNGRGICNDNSVYYSTDPSKSWVLIEEGLPDHFVGKSIAIHDNTVFISGNGIYKTQFENPEFWETVNDTLMVNSIHSINNVLFGLSDFNVYYSDDDGETWNLFGDEQDFGSKLNCFSSDGEVVFIGTESNGAWSNKAITTSVTFNEAEKRTTIPIVQIMPNPGNGLFAIKADNEIESIKVYTFTGQVFNGFIFDTTSGEFNLRMASKGLYFVHVFTIEGPVVLKVVVQ